MDSGVLVASGHALTDLLSAGGFEPRAVMWVHNPDTDTWRLWVVPPNNAADKHDFYRRLASIISANRETLGGLDAGDVEFVPADHPAIKGLGRMYRVEGRSDVRVSRNMLNGFYLPDGIILRMMI